MDGYLTVSEVAKVMNMGGEEWVRAQIRTGRLRAKKIGRSYLVKKEWIDEFFEGHPEHEPSGNPGELET